MASHIYRMAALDENDPLVLIDALLAVLEREKLTEAKREVERAAVSVRQGWADRSTVVTWDWKPAARHVEQYLDDVGTPATNVWMTKRPGGPIEINFQMGDRRNEPKFSQGKFNTLRRQLERKFGLIPQVDENRYKLQDGQRVEVNIFYGGTPSGERLASQSSRVASKYLAEFRSPLPVRSAGMATNPLDGLKKQRVLTLVNALLTPHTKGQFRDNGWAPIHAIWAGLDKAGIQYEPLDGTGRYEKEDGRDVRKVWRYRVPFTNQNGRPDAVYISITASGTGPVADPLEVYDVVAYAS